MNKLKHWSAFVVFWTIAGPLILGCVAGVVYTGYLIVTAWTEAILFLAGFGAFMLTIRWAGNFLDKHGFLPWKPKDPN